MIGQFIHFVFGRDGSHVLQEKWHSWQNPFKSRNIFSGQSQPVPAAFKTLPRTVQDWQTLGWVLVTRKLLTGQEGNISLFYGLNTRIYLRLMFLIQYLWLVGL